MTAKTKPQERCPCCNDAVIGVEAVKCRGCGAIYYSDSPLRGKLVVRDSKAAPRPLPKLDWERILATKTPFAVFDLSVNLLPYQREMVRYAVERELRRAGKGEKG